MRTLDASSVVHAWDNYPVEKFPGLWQWLENQFQDRQLSMSSVAYIEVKDKFPAIAIWLTKAGVQKHAPDNEIIVEAMRLKQLLQIQNDEYRGGVGENDLFIIATAKILGVDLVSNEARQPKLPEILAKYKIPAVCQMSTVDVRCISFVQLIQGSDAVF